MAACTHTHSFASSRGCAGPPSRGQQLLGSGSPGTVPGNRAGPARAAAPHPPGGRSRRRVRPCSPVALGAASEEPGGPRESPGGAAASGAPGGAQLSSARPPRSRVATRAAPPAPSPGPPRRARSFFAFSFFFLLFLFIFFFNPSRGAAAGAGGAGNSRSERRAGRPSDGSDGAAVPPAPQSFPVNMVIPSAFLSTHRPSLPTRRWGGRQRGWGRGGCKSGV